MTNTNTTASQADATQLRRKVPLNEMGDFIRSSQHLSPAIRELINKNRQQVEAHRAIFRNLIDGFQQQMAAALNLDARRMAKIPDDVVEQLIANGVTARSLHEIPQFPEAQLNISFTSEVTVNGVRLPDEDEA